MAAIFPSGISSATTDSSNTTFPTSAGGNTSIAEGMAPSGVNNALRSMATMIAASWGGMYSGSARPAAVQAGSLWRDTSGGATANVINYFDGSDDIGIFTINTTANTIKLIDPITRTADTAMSGAGTYTQAIPSGTEWIAVSFDSVSLSGTDSVDIRVGTSSSLVSSGYDQFTGLTDGATTESAAASSGCRVRSQGDAANDLGGIATFVHRGANKWTFTCIYGVGSADAVGYSAGSVTLGGELDIIGLAATGSNTFDAGTFSISHM